jgi:hypothetical protein
MNILERVAPLRSLLKSNIKDTVRYFGVRGNYVSFVTTGIIKRLNRNCGYKQCIVGGVIIHQKAALGGNLHQTFQP